MASNCAPEMEKTTFNTGIKTFSDKILNQLYQNFLDGHHCDLVVYVQGRCFNAHRCVLSALSPKITRMLNCKPFWPLHELILDPRLPEHIMEYLLKFMYTGSVDVSNDAIKDLFIWATFLEIKELIQAMEYMFPKANEDAKLNLEKEKEGNGSRTENRRKSSKPRKHLYIPDNQLQLQPSPLSTTSNINSDQTSSSSSSPSMMLDDPVDFSNTDEKSQPEQPEEWPQQNQHQQEAQQQHKPEQEHQTHHQQQIQEQLDMQRHLLLTSHIYGPGQYGFFGCGPSGIGYGPRNAAVEATASGEATTSDTAGIPSGPINDAGSSQEGKKSFKGKKSKRKGRGFPASSNWARDENGKVLIGASGKPMVQCETCQKILADPSSLYRHRKIHTNERPHQCPKCDKTFIQRYNMRQHVKTHLNRKSRKSAKFSNSDSDTPSRPSSTTVVPEETSVGGNSSLSKELLQVMNSFSRTHLLAAKHQNERINGNGDGMEVDKLVREKIIQHFNQS